MDSHQTTRRRFLAVLGTAVPALASIPSQSRATELTGAGLSFAQNLWMTLERVTDGTDPSTAVIAEPHFTESIRSLVGTQIELVGYLQPLSIGFGQKPDYLLSRTVFHCPYCYGSGRGSLAVVSLRAHPSIGADKKIKVRGEFAVQDKDPSDFYFQLKNADLVS